MKKWNAFNAKVNFILPCVWNKVKIWVENCIKSYCSASFEVFSFILLSMQNVQHEIEWNEPYCCCTCNGMNDDKTKSQNKTNNCINNMTISIQMCKQKYGVCEVCECGPFLLHVIFAWMCVATSLCFAQWKQAIWGNWMEAMAFTILNYTCAAGEPRNFLANSGLQKSVLIMFIYVSRVKLFQFLSTFYDISLIVHGILLDYRHR